MTDLLMGPLMATRVNRLFIIFTIKDKLHDGVDGLVSGADTKETDDILVIEAFHHFGLAEEIQLLFNGRAYFQCLDSYCHLETCSNFEGMKSCHNVTLDMVVNKNGLFISLLHVH